MESLVQLQNIIKGYFEANDNVKSVYAMDAAYAWNNHEVEYISVAFDLTGVNVNDDITSYTFRFYAGARQREDIDPTTNPNYEQLYTILESTFRTMETDAVGDLENLIVGVERPRNYTFANLKMMDVLAVATVDVTIDIDNNYCED